MIQGSVQIQVCGVEQHRGVALKVIQDMVRSDSCMLPGYQLVGNDTRVCTDTGVWSGTAPRCSIKGNARYGEKVIHACYPGYQLVGNDTRVCTDTGVWSGAAPRCSIKGNT